MTGFLSGVITPIQKFTLSLAQASGLLFIAAALAIIAANGEYRSYYETFLNYPVTFQIGSYNLFSHGGHPLTVHAFVNDALMTIFFFMIGLEIKRELLVGELATMRKALLPIIAATGGMIIPVCVYYCFNSSGPGVGGAAIPMATDIAFALGVLTMLGKRVPLGLKIFLTALAVVDDIGGIMVIALFYSSSISWTPLLIALVFFFIVYIAGKLGIRSRVFYYFMLILIWQQFMDSGLHATIAGVITAMLVPARPKVKLNDFLIDVNDSLNHLPMNHEISRSGATILSDIQINALKRIESVTDRSISTLQALTDDLHNIVNFVILPLFAFVNAGVVFGGESGSLISSISLGVTFALLVGKTIGIFSFTYLGVKLNLVSMPTNANFKQIFAISILGGIGFTVSLFIADLAFSGSADAASLLNQAKIGIFAGSIISGLIGYFTLSSMLKK